MPTRDTSARSSSSPGWRSGSATIALSALAPLAVTWMFEPAAVTDPPALSRTDAMAPEARAVSAVPVAAPALREPAAAPAVAPATETPPAVPDDEQYLPFSEIDADRDAVLFITIVGEQTYYHWGRVGDRPPRIDAAGLAGDGQRDGVQPVADPAPDAGTAGVADAAEAVAFENPYGPEPQECPRTLPPGSSQADADALRSQSGCRYLSSCSAEMNECTWHYQGRG